MPRSAALAWWGATACWFLGTLAGRLTGSHTALTGAVPLPVALLVFAVCAGLWAALVHAAYRGLNPKIKQSGQTARIGRMSKAGPDTLRWAAVEASQQAWHILSRDQPFKPAAPRAATPGPASSSIRLAH